MNASAATFLSGRYFGWAVALIVLCKLLIAWLLPLTGDEAYFVIWGSHPALGYYDHPPMVGWWLSVMMLFGEHHFIYRLPAVLVSMVPALVLYRIFYKQHRDKAKLLALIALLIPLFMVGVLITTDTPLILFGLLSVVACWKALRTNSVALFLLSGALLGAAFLSKYFAVLIGMGYLLHFVLFARRQWPGLLWIVLGALPFVALNIYWNWQNCWYNVMFNLLNRHSSGAAEWGNVPLYLFTLLYILTPWLLWFAWRERRQIVDQIRHQGLGIFFSAALVPLLLLLLISPGARIGLHWLAVFVPMLLVAGFFINKDQLIKASRWTAWLAVAHIALVLLIIFFPLEQLKDHRRYSDALFYLQPQKMAVITEGYGDEVHFFTGSYSRSAMLSHYSGRYFGVLGMGSHYGRQDDLISNLEALNGKDMVYLTRRGEGELEALQTFFDELRYRELTVAGATVGLAEGYGFRYAAYREAILQPLFERYYDFPSWLPLGQCRFAQQYSGA